MKSKKTALLHSIISLLLCVSMLCSTTFAWFTDSVTTGINTIAAGTLDVELYHSNAVAAEEKVVSATELFLDLQGEDILWEPGVVSYENLRVANEGDLALAYQLEIVTDKENYVIDPSGAQYGLSQILKVGFVEGGITATDRAGVMDSVADADWTTLDSFIRGGSLMPKGTDPDEQIWGVVICWEPGENDNLWNLNNNKQLSSGEVLSIDLGIRLVATQEVYESDSFGKDYDAGAKEFLFPEYAGGSASATVVPDADNKTSAQVTMTDGHVSAVVPAGVQLADGADKLTMSVTPMNAGSANITLGDGEESVSLDVHIEGVSAANTVPITVTLKKAAPAGLNAGNYKLYHVENGATNEMTSVAADADFTAHNQFKYDPATGDITLYMATFSEVALVADTVNAWNDDYDYGWYDADAEELTIANADQLAGFGAIVGGMDGQTQDSFAEKTVKLISDINLGDKESENNPDIIFYPIGYYNSNRNYEKVSGGSVTSNVSSFSGTFDGAGHTIANFYQNTWEMFGDYNNGYSGTPNHYKDAMGLFGYVNGGTVKNLTVDNFSSDGEFTPTGVIAAFADGDAKFENIAITNCNPRVYNTGNGGIIGIAGDTSAANDDHITLKNITVDNSNKISALWGSWDVACGGLVGMYRGNVDGSGNATGDTIGFENCHVAAQIDVYNDVCANYQYYAYRYAGMIIGSVRHNTTNKDGKTIPDMTGISAAGCTVNYGDWNDYYYCEFEKNSMASYSEDYQFSRVPHSELNFTDSNGNGVVDADERASVTGCKHTHTAEENHQAIYLPFHQLFTGYSWGVNSIGLEKYSGIVTDLGITEGDQEESVEKFETKFTGDFLYRVGNQNTVAVGNLFDVIKGEDGTAKYDINSSGVVVSIVNYEKDANVSGTFKANTSDWTKGTIQFSGAGLAKVTIQDYNFCKPTELIVEVVDATNLTSATGTTSGGNFVLLCDVNTTTYVNYWNATLYGNGFTYSLNGAPTAYNSKQGHGVMITKNTTLDNLVIVGDVYNSYGVYTSQDNYNAAVDVVGDTTIRNCYIANCATPVKAREDVTIENSTLYGGAVANLIIMSGIVTLEDVTTVNYADGRTVFGLGVAVHPDATESAKLALNGTFTQYNYLCESAEPEDSNAQALYDGMFDDQCKEYHYGTSPSRYINAGIVSMNASFNGEDISDNANTGYAGTVVRLSGNNGYLYSEKNPKAINNNYEGHIREQGAVPPSYSFDYTEKNYVAKQDGSNDYCYEANGQVNISMDEGDTFSWDTSILTVKKGEEELKYTVSMGGTDYTGKSIVFSEAGEYEVKYTYTDPNNYKANENGEIVTYSKTYTKTVNITVAVIEATTKHAEFTFGSSNTASTTVTVGNNTYVMPNVSATSSTIGSTTVSGQTIYYPIVEIVMSDGKTTHSSGWYAYFPVFSGAVTITDYKDNGAGDAETFESNTQSMPSGLSIVGDPATLFKYQSSSSAATSPAVKSKILVYSSPKIEANRSEYNLVIQYSYQDNAGATYYYYIGYHAPAQTYSPGCFIPDTLITLADGSQKRVDELRFDDKILAWDFFTGSYTEKDISLLVNHGAALYKVANLRFSDGTLLRVIAEHGVFDYDLNKYVYFTVDNMDEYIGHRFVQYDANGGYRIVTLKDAYETEEYTSAWSVSSAGTSNAFASGLLTVAPPEDFYNWIDMGGKLVYDVEQFQHDVKIYGLYTYEDFKDYVTEEQFAAWNGAYLKIPVEKGYFTFDYILELIELYKGWMPQN